MAMNFKGIDAAMLKMLIIGFIFLGILLNVMSTLIPDASEDYYNMVQNFNETHIGTDANSFASDSVGYLGWFFVLVGFILVLNVLTGTGNPGGRKRKKSKNKGRR